MHYEIRTRNISNNKYLRSNKSYGQENFYINLQSYIDYNKETILTSDFNMIESIFLDRIGGNPQKAHNWHRNLTSN